MLHDGISPSNDGISPSEMVVTIKPIFVISKGDFDNVKPQ